MEAMLPCGTITSGKERTQAERLRSIALDSGCLASESSFVRYVAGGVLGIRKVVLEK